MKYLSLLVFLFALQWTWSFSHQTALISESVHLGIQEDLKAIIGDYIVENLPTAKNLKFNKFWSEKINKDRVKASFSYSFDDSSEESGSARIDIEGFAILNRKVVAEADSDDWTLDELNILNNRINFEDALQINGRPEGSK